MDLNGKDPVVDSSLEWLRTSPAERGSSSDSHRQPERRRVRRRARKRSDVRSRIRLRVWLACTGALLVMALVMYLAIGRERPGESGLGPRTSAPSVAALDGAFASRG